MNNLIVLSIVYLLLCTQALATDRLQPSDLTYQGAWKLPTTSIGTKTLVNSGSNPVQMGYDNSTGGLIVQGVDTTDVERFALTSVVMPATPVMKGGTLLEGTFATGKNDLVDLSGGLQKSTSVSSVVQNAISTRLNDAEYLPAYGSQTSAKYHYVFRMNYSTDDTNDYRIGWADTDFTNLNPAGLWRLDGIFDRQYDFYMLKIDPTWADATTATTGQYIGVGRGRTGGSHGPALYSYAPWSGGNPPADQASVTDFTELMYYPSTQLMETFSMADMYNDAVLIKKGTAAAFVVYTDKSFRHDATCANCNMTTTTNWWTSAGTGRSVGYKAQEAEPVYTTGDIDDTATDIPLTDVSALSPSGLIKVGGEMIKYTGISANTLTGCVRGYHYDAASHISGTKANQIMPDIYDYGVSSTGTYQNGFDSLFRFPMLLFYDVDEIAEIAAGTRATYNIQPYAYMQIGRHFYRSNAQIGYFPPAAAGVGMTWDDSGTLYVGEFDGVRNGAGRETVIHQFSIGLGGASDAAPPANPSEVSVTSGGVLSWVHSQGDEDLYIIYKFFADVYKTVDEYRPIITTELKTWTDPNYTAGDQYQVQVVDGSMNLSARTSSGSSESPGTKTPWRIGGSALNWTAN